MISTEYEGRQAYRCSRCHEWAFISEIDMRAAAIMHADALTCPYCDTEKSLQPVGRVERQEVVSESQRTACDERCTQAVGVVCVCKCAAVNHGTGRMVVVRRVEGHLEIILKDIERAKRIKPRLLAEIAEYEAVLAKAKATYTDTRSAWSGQRMPWNVYGPLHTVSKDIRRAADLHSHAGRMRVLNGAIKAMAGLPTPLIKPEPYVPSPVVQAVRDGGAVNEITPVRIQEMATYRQVAYADSLRRARGNAADAAIDLHDLTKADASRYIDALLHLPVNQVVSARGNSAPAPLAQVQP